MGKEAGALPGGNPQNLRKTEPEPATLQARRRSRHTPAVATGDLDQRLRAAAFAHLDRLRARNGDRISYRDLEAFELEGSACL